MIDPMLKNNRILQLFDNRYNNRINLLDNFLQLFRDRYNNRLNVINYSLEMSKKRREIIEKFDNDSKASFNIFQNLSIDSNFNEINHSRMLEKIFSTDDTNKDINDKEYLNIFIRLIEKIKKEKIKNQFENSFYVIREFGRNKSIKERARIKERGAIDIFIYNDKNSIIIENKITQKAGDKDDQLARYYLISRQFKRPPVAIIYMPFYHKVPPYNYTGKYEKYIKTIRDLVVIIPALDPIDGNDLTHGFLDECSKYAKSINNITACVCLDQYSKFIKSKGDGNEMATNEDKKFIENILSNEELRKETEDIFEIWNKSETKRKNDENKFIDYVNSNDELRKTIEDIVEIWNKREELIGYILLDHLHNNFGFNRVKDGFFGKMINKDIFVYFDSNFQFGYGSINGKLEKIKNKLKNIITNRSEVMDFNNYSDSSWVFGDLKKDLFYGDINEKKKKLTSLVRTFEKEIRGVLKGKTS